MNERYPKWRSPRRTSRSSHSSTRLGKEGHDRTKAFYAAVVSSDCQVVINVIAEPNAIAADVVRRPPHQQTDAGQDRPAK